MLRRYEVIVLPTLREELANRSGVFR